MYLLCWKYTYIQVFTYYHLVWSWGLEGYSCEFELPNWVFEQVLPQFWIHIVIFPLFFWFGAGGWGLGLTTPNVYSAIKYLQLLSLTRTHLHPPQSLCFILLGQHFWKLKCTNFCIHDQVVWGYSLWPYVLFGYYCCVVECPRLRLGRERFMN